MFIQEQKHGNQSNDLAKIFNESSEKMSEMEERLISTVLSLSTASLVFSVTLFDKLDVNNIYNCYLKLSWIFLLLAIVTGIIAKFLLINQENNFRNEIYEHMINKKNDDKIITSMPSIQIIINYLFSLLFIVGILFLVIYSIMQV